MHDTTIAAAAPPAATSRPRTGIEIASTLRDAYDASSPNATTTANCNVAVWYSRDAMSANGTSRASTPTTARTIFGICALPITNPTTTATSAKIPTLILIIISAPVAAPTQTMAAVLCVTV